MRSKFYCCNKHLNIFSRECRQLSGPETNFHLAKMFDSAQLWLTFAWAASKSMQWPSSFPFVDAKGCQSQVKSTECASNLVQRLCGIIKNFCPASWAVFSPQSLDGASLAWLRHFGRTHLEDIFLYCYFSNLCPSAEGITGWEKGQRMQVKLNSFFACWRSLKVALMDAAAWSSSYFSPDPTSSIRRRGSGTDVHPLCPVCELCVLRVRRVLVVLCGSCGHCTMPSVLYGLHSLEPCKSWAFKGII